MNPIDAAYLFLTSDGRTTVGRPFDPAAPFDELKRVEFKHAPLWWRQSSFFDKGVQKILRERHPTRDQSQTEPLYAVGAWIEADRAALPLLYRKQMEGFNSILAQDALWAARLLVSVIAYWQDWLIRGIERPNGAKEKKQVWLRQSLLKQAEQNRFEDTKLEVLARDIYGLKDSDKSVGRIKTADSKDDKRRREIMRYWAPKGYQNAKKR
jgi:hypothetical protein